MLRSRYLPFWALLAAVVLVACTQQPVQEDSLPLAPAQSPSDDREYRYIELDNGLVKHTELGWKFVNDSQQIFLP